MSIKIEYLYSDTLEGLEKIVNAELETNNNVEIAGNLTVNTASIYRKYIQPIVRYEDD